MLGKLNLEKECEVMSKAMLIIEMPKDCCSCEFEEYRKDTDLGDGEYCYINSGQCTADNRPGHCPLIKIPESQPSLLDKMEPYLNWCERTGNEFCSDTYQEYLDQETIEDVFKEN